jgi:acyl-CoA synthetase (AMP-forming)/AMP-acid ligase II
VSRPPASDRSRSDSWPGAKVAAVLAAHRDGRELRLPTSGTTGEARAVVRTTASWWASFDPYSELTGVERGARLWVPGPLTGTMNLFAAVHAAVVGAEVVDVPGEATHACLTPTVLDRRGNELSPGTRVVVAGAALFPATHGAAARHLDIVHYYGAAELSFVAAGSHAGDLRPFAGAEVEERDGELWVRSPYVAQGYADGRSGPLRRDADGWATVGDLGRIEDGRVVVLGRPDTVTTGGATVVLAEVEAALADAAAAPFAVVGVPHPALGAVLTAVATAPDDLVTMRDRARQLPSSHRPRRWETRDALPLTTAGKVDRRALVSALSAEPGARDG